MWVNAHELEDVIHMEVTAADTKCICLNSFQSPFPSSSIFTQNIGTQFASSCEPTLSLMESEIVSCILSICKA